jgi:hypothetical protein
VPSDSATPCISHQISLRTVTMESYSNVLMSVLFFPVPCAFKDRKRLNAWNMNALFAISLNRSFTFVHIAYNRHCFYIVALHTRHLTLALSFLPYKIHLSMRRSSVLHFRHSRHLRMTSAYVCCLLCQFTQTVTCTEIAE